MTGDSKLTVGIIGAGAAGLCAARHVLSAAKMTPVVWEQSKVVGGTWVYTDCIEKDEHQLPIHSSMYQSLKANLPKELMAFPDFPFEVCEESFMHHTAVFQYLKDYTDHFNLEQHIKFEHMVEEVAPRRPGERDTDWLVTVKDLTTNTSTTTLCHAVLVCNGHYAIPYIPSMEGIEQFSGSVLHSHSYREPSAYTNKIVAVLGASASGLDISFDLASVAKKVYLCHNMPLPFPAAMPNNLHQTVGIVSVKRGTSNTFVLKDGTFISVDALLFCTGYHFKFPFLSEECGVSVTNNQVRPLYRHLIHCNYPSLAFVGIPSRVCPFPLFDLQVRYVVACLMQLVDLPSYSVMKKATQEELETRASRGYSAHHYHKFVSTDLQWDYMKLLQADLMAAKLSLLQPENTNVCAKDRIWPFSESPDDILPTLVPLWDMVTKRLVLQTTEFKKYQYRSVSRGKEGSGGAVEFEEVLHGQVVSHTWDVTKKVMSVLPQYVCRNLGALIKFVLTLAYYRIKRILVSK